MTLIQLLQLIEALPALITGFENIVAMLESHFGPDWVQKLNDVNAANQKLQTATTQGEKDAALIAIAGAFYRKP